MATKNRFDLLGDDDPSLLAAVAKKSERQAAMHAPATVGRSEGNSGGRGYGRGGRGGFNPGSGGGGGGHGYGRGGRGGYSTPGQGAPEDRTQGAPEDRRGGASEIIARASEIIRDAPTRGTWGDLSDIVTKQGTPNAEPEDKKPEHEEMKTFQEHEKAPLKEKMKALQALQREERKVDSTAFQSMQQLSNKKDNDDIFVKQTISINEFLKLAEGEVYYSPGGRGRGRGGYARGYGGGARRYGGRDSTSSVLAPAIEDPDQFPTLGGK